jgi:small subunit ribosomal protein S12
MPTINQLVRKGRETLARRASLPPCVTTRRSAGCARASTPRPPRSPTRRCGRSPVSGSPTGLRGDGVHPRRGAQPAGAQHRAHPRRPGEGPPRRPLPHHPRHARRRPGVNDRRQSRSKYGAKRPKAGAAAGKGAPAQGRKGKEVSHEPPHSRRQAPDHPGPGLRVGDDHEVRQHADARRQEVDRREHLLRRHEGDRGAHRPARPRRSSRRRSTTRSRSSR